MGLTYAQSFLAAHVLRPADLMLLVRNPEKVSILSQQLHIEAVYSQPGDFIAAADLIVLAVKPQDSAALFPHIRPYLHSGQSVLSVMAGVTLGTLAAGLGTQKIIRAMPNLPAQIGMGMTAFTATPEVTRNELIYIQNLLSTTGRVMYFDDESMIDASTAVSGSGPAYIFYFMEAMLKAAREMGFSQSEADLLVWQTFNGALHLINKNSLSCEDWIKKVASKGGTTEAALRIFGQHTVDEAIEAGMMAALSRARELGR